MVALLSTDFVDWSWGKHAAELPLQKVLFNEHDVFGALRAYAEHADEIRARHAQSEAITAFNGNRTSKPRADFLVLATDNSFDEYVSRIDRLAGTDEWTVMYYGLHAASPIIWDIAKAFSDQLAASIGYRPGGRVDVDCFIGRYSSTYVGVHVDHAHNFGFTLRDGKTMFTWPASRKDLLGLRFPHYEPFKCEGVPLRNKREWVAYFPEDWLHVAETKSDVSVNVNVAFWESDDESRKTVNYVTASIKAPQRTRHDVRSSGVANLNTEDELLFLSLKTLINDDYLKNRLLISQLISDTSGRLNVGRPPVEIEEIDDVVALDDVSTLQWKPIDEESRILVAANGHCASFKYTRHLLDFLDALSAGRRVDISRLSVDEAGRPDNDFLTAVATLARWGAIR
jgi:hypothetical protein